MKNLAAFIGVVQQVDRQVRDGDGGSGRESDQQQQASFILL